MNSSSDAILQICQLFFGEGLKAQEIAEELAQKGYHFNRQAILPKLVEAYAAGMVRLIPPRHTQFEERLAKRFNLEPNRLWVIDVDDDTAKNAAGRWAEVHVAAAAADLVLEQLKQMWIDRRSQSGERSPIQLGLGPGRAALEFSQFLSQRLHADPEAPDLTLVAITGGGVPNCPQYAPLSFFNLFPAELVKRSVGLFAEMLVPQETFEKIKDEGVGVREAFIIQPKVDIVVTAMGDFHDSDDLLKLALESAHVPIGSDWIGNVQYRPYSKTKPILQRGTELRAVTLFELSDFVEMARDPNKRVVLIARRCGVCGTTKAAAVRPLLEKEELRVFSHLVMDLATARELLDGKSAKKKHSSTPAPSPRNRISDEDQSRAWTYWLCDAFFNRKKSIREIGVEADKLEYPLIRETLYHRLAKAGSAKMGLIQVIKPLEKQLVDALAAKFQLPTKHIHVVDSGHPEGGQEVAAVAASVVLELAEGLADACDRTVGLGLGPGRATLDFSRHLGRLLREGRESPLFDLIAISAGCVPEYPKFAAESFFNLFPMHAVKSRIGLFAETLVTSKEFRQIVEDLRPGVKEALDKRDRNEIDIIVTAIGDYEDEHDLLKMLMEKQPHLHPKWVGSVQHRPYTKEGPIREGDQDWRAVTLFELDDLVQLAKEKGKHVVLIARQCRLCERTRAAALRPLLTEPNLRVWSELVMDVATARELVRGS